MNARKRIFGGDGCGFLVATCFVTCCFLAINSTLVRIAFVWLAPLGPEFLRIQRSEQIIMFAAPMLLVVGEWWLVDKIVDWLTPANGNGNGQGRN